jgi:hypothetical protein
MGTVVLRTAPPDSEPIAALLRRARRRLALASAATAATFALAVALAGSALVLITGDQVLPWPAVLWSALAALGLALYREWRRFPDPATIARRIDTALANHDLLATATYVLSRPNNSVLAPAITAAAGAFAAGADISAAMPWRWPGPARACGALLAVVAALGGLRYGLLHSIDTHPPLAGLSRDPFTGRFLPSRGAPRPLAPRPLAPISPEPDRPADVVAHHLPPEELNNYETVGQTTAGLRMPNAPANNANARSSGARAPGRNDEAQAPNDEAAPQPESGPSRSTGPPAADPAQQRNEGLLDRVKNAIASIMDRIRTEPGEGQNPAESTPGAAAQRRPDHAPEAGRTPHAEHSASDSPPGDQAGENDQNGKSSATGAAPPEAANQRRSGAGSQEGNKALAQAEEQQAVGKLSELIGKRSLQVKGEISVEVEAADNRRLSTPLLDRNARHADRGGVLSRDEVPLRLQPFIRRYYEKLRSQPDSLPPTRPAPAGGSSGP